MAAIPSPREEISLDDIGDISSPNEDNERKIVIVIAGKRETGKSTLLNNILHLSEDEGATTGMSTEPVTTEVTVYSAEVDGIKLKVVDVPGLGVEAQSDDDRHDLMAQLIVKTNKEADILLYCASMCPGNHIDSTDIEILTLLRMVFEKDLFKHCILVNTFANYIPEATIKGRAEGTARHFLGALKGAGIPDIEVKAIQSNQDEGYKGILGIPAGILDISDDSEKENPKNWRSTLQQEIVNKVCEDEYKPCPLEIRKFKTAVMMMCFNRSTFGMVEKIQFRKLKKENVGPAMYKKCYDTKKKVKSKLKKLK